MKSGIKNNIKWLRIFAIALTLYMISYNAYFGWNEEPINSTEDICDKALSIGIGLWIGMFMAVIIKYIDFKMDLYIAMLKNK